MRPCLSPSEILYPMVNPIRRRQFLLICPEDFRRDLYHSRCRVREDKHNLAQDGFSFVLEDGGQATGDGGCPRHSTARSQHRAGIEILLEMYTQKSKPSLLPTPEKCCKTTSFLHSFFGRGVVVATVPELPGATGALHGQEHLY